MRVFTIVMFSFLFAEPPKSLMVSAEFGQQRIPNVVGPFRIGDRPKFTCTVEGGTVFGHLLTCSSFLLCVGYANAKLRPERNALIIMLDASERCEFNKAFLNGPLDIWCDWSIKGSGEREGKTKERERERRGLAGAKVSQQGFRHVFQTRPPNFNQELLSPHPSIRVDEVLKWWKRREADKFLSALSFSFLN